MRSSSLKQGKHRPYLFRAFDLRCVRPYTDVDLVVEIRHAFWGIMAITNPISSARS
jgi:hypothetical protein